MNKQTMNNNIVKHTYNYVVKCVFIGEVRIVDKYINLEMPIQLCATPLSCVKNHDLNVSILLINAK